MYVVNKGDTRGHDSVADPSYTVYHMIIIFYFGPHNIQHKYVCNVFKRVCNDFSWLWVYFSIPHQRSLSRPLVFSHGTAIATLQYSREYLLNLQYRPNILPPKFDFNIPKITSNMTKCGSRRGVRNHIETCGYRPPHPAITLYNVRSIRYKMDELSTLLMHDSDNRRKSLLCFTESWLTEWTTYAGLDGYTTICSDTNFCIRKH